MTLHPTLKRRENDPWGLRGAPEVANALSGRAKRILKAGLQLRRPVPNGFHDPLSQMLVVEALLNTQPDMEFLTKGFVERLRLDYGHILWDAVTVGRILGDLAESLEDVCPGPLNPLRRRRLSEGNVYTLVETLAGWPVLIEVRRQLQRLAEAEIAQTQRGIRPDHLTSPLEQCAVLRVVTE